VSFVQVKKHRGFVAEILEAQRKSNIKEIGQSETIKRFTRIQGINLFLVVVFLKTLEGPKD